MALSMKKKKDESTNEKIVRLFQEGKSVDEICAEIELRNDIVVGVIRRKLGDDAVPDAVVTAKPKPVAVEVENEAVEEEADLEGMSKLERYMLEKKKKQQEEANNEAVKAEEAPVENESEENSGSVSLVDDYKKQANISEPAVAENTASTAGEMDAISIDDIPSIEPEVEETAPVEDESVEMDAISPVEIANADAVAENNFTAPTPATETAEPVSEHSGDNASSAVNKMKAFALSQIEANNSKISELEAKASQLENEFAPQLEEANSALNASQNTFENIEARYTQAYADLEKAREDHRIEIAKADEEYRKKLEKIDEEYKEATATANEKFRSFEDATSAKMENLDSEKTTAQADLLAKQNAVTELRAKISSEGDEIAKQIQSLKDENDGYQGFLV